MDDMNTENTVNDVRKPRVALMGEFSAGKSTLSNLMLGQRPLPERVTATQLPPVWLCYGNDAPFREDLDGTHHPVDLDDLEAVPLEQTLYIKIFIETDILQLCDFIDMPGISDPNMPPAVWERMVQHADGVIWCTHATQAWRQSEAAVWADMSPQLREQSLLLITRIDKVRNDRDRNKLIRRVHAETADLFASIFPVSLLAAVQAGDDWDAWRASGAEAFTDELIDLLGSMNLIGVDETEPAAMIEEDDFDEAPVISNAPIVLPVSQALETKADVPFDAQSAFEAEVDDHAFDDAFEDDVASEAYPPEPEVTETPPSVDEVAQSDDNTGEPTSEVVHLNAEPSRPVSAGIVPRRVRRLSNNDGARPDLPNQEAEKPVKPVAQLSNLREVFSAEKTGYHAEASEKKAAGI